MCTKNEGLARLKIFTSSQAKAWHLDEVCALNFKRQLWWALYCSRRFSSVFRDQPMTYTLCGIIEEVAIFIQLYSCNAKKHSSGCPEYSK